MTEREIIAKVNQRLDKLGMTQSEISQKIGVSTSLVNRFLVNRGNSMSFDKVCKLMEALGLDISVTCSEEEDETDEDSDEEEEEVVQQILDKATYEAKMLKMRGKSGDMEYDSKLYFAYQNLANAIILLAVDDYRQLLSSNKSGAVFNVSIDRRMETIDDIEKFFKSGYYRELTNVDGEYLISALRKEAKIVD